MRSSSTSLSNLQKTNTHATKTLPTLFSLSLPLFLFLSLTLQHAQALNEIDLSCVLNIFIDKKYAMYAMTLDLKRELKSDSTPNSSCLHYALYLSYFQNRAFFLPQWLKSLYFMFIHIYFYTCL